jgi:hypothetical protein
MFKIPVVKEEQQVDSACSPHCKFRDLRKSLVTSIKISYELLAMEYNFKLGNVLFYAFSNICTDEFENANTTKQFQ